MDREPVWLEPRRSQERAVGVWGLPGNDKTLVFTLREMKTQQRVLSRGKTTSG